MLIRDIMTHDVEAIHPDASLEDAARKMRTLDVGLLPICDGDRLVGMLTDRDITVRATAEGLNTKTTPARDVMTPDVVYCFEDQEISDAVRIMEQYQIRRLPVLNRDKRLVGIVSLGDLAVRDTAAEDHGLDEEVLVAVSQPAAPNQ
jgi:CBS domain-containing protein